MTKRQNKIVEQYFTQHNRFFHDELDCWQLCQKFCRNSKTITSLSHELRQLILSSVTTPIHEILPLFQKWFTYQLLPSGEYNFFFKKEFYFEFKKRFGKYLRTEAERLDQQCPVCDLKYFIRFYKAGNQVKIQQLKDYIFQHALSLTYEKQGKKIPVFSVKAGAISIQKEAIPTFIKTHLKQLEQMGFERLELQVDNNHFFRDFKGFGVDKIAHLLEIKDKDKLTLFLKKPICQCVEVMVMKNGEPKLQPLMFEKNGHMLLGQDFMPYFVAHFHEQLKALGANEGKLQFFAGVNELTPYQKQIRPLKKLFQLLSLAPCAELSAEIMSLFSDAVYVDSLTQKKEKVFVKTLWRNKIHTWFRNNEALLCFIQNNRAFFEKKRALPQRIDVVLGKALLRNWDEQYIALNDLGKCLKVPRENYSKLQDICLQDFREGISDKNDKNGAPLLFLTKRHNKGRVIYALDPSGLKTFVNRYGAMLDLNPFVMQNILQEQPIEKVYKGYLSLHQLWQLMGCGASDQFQNLSAFVGQIYQTARFHKRNLFGFPYPFKTPMFRLMQAGNQKTTFYIDREAVPYFMQSYKNELLTLGFKKEQLEKTHKQVRLIETMHQGICPVPAFKNKSLERS